MIELFNTAIVYPLTNVLAVFNIAFENLGLPGAFGLAIVSFTVFIRLILYPLYKKQNETTRRMGEIKPKLDELKEKHKNDSAKLQQEQIRIYQEAGINPASGCVLILIQIPLFLGLFQALNMFVHSRGQTIDIEALNAVLYYDSLRVQELDLSFLWLNLAVTPANGESMLYFLVPLVTGILQFYQANTVMVSPPGGAKKEDEKAKKGKKGDTAEEFQRVMQMQMKYVFPFVIAAISYTVPVALALYWNVFSLFSIMQYYLTRDRNDQNTQADPKSSKKQQRSLSEGNQEEQSQKAAIAESAQSSPEQDESPERTQNSEPKQNQSDQPTAEAQSEAPRGPKHQKPKKGKKGKKKGKRS